jgi:hypothetical protein
MPPNPTYYHTAVSLPISLLASNDGGVSFLEVKNNLLLQYNIYGMDGDINPFKMSQCPSPQTDPLFLCHHLFAQRSVLLLPSQKPRRGHDWTSRV